MAKNEISDNKDRRIFGVSVSVFILSLAAFLTNISSEMIKTVLPLYTTSVGGTPLFLGLIAGMSAVTSYFMSGISGYLRNKNHNNKKFLIGGYIISNLSKPFIGFVPSWVYVLGLKSTDGFGRGLKDCEREEVNCYCDIEERRDLWKNRSTDILGLIIGSLITFFLLLFAWTYSQIIIIAIIPGLIVIFLILTIKYDKFNLMTRKLDIPPKENQMNDKKDKSTIKIILCLGVLEFATIDSLFLIIRSVSYISKEAIFFIPLFFAFSYAVCLVFSPILERLSEVIGRKPVVIAGLSLLIIASIVLALPTKVSMVSFILLFVIFAFYGFYLASVIPMARAYITDFAEKYKQYRVIGYYYLFVGIFYLAIALLVGLIYFMISYTWAFIFISILILICIIVFVKTNLSEVVYDCVD